MEVNGGREKGGPPGSEGVIRVRGCGRGFPKNTSRGSS
jgi:hypothetical protein